MRNLAILIILFTAIFSSCQTKAENFAANLNEVSPETIPLGSPTPIASLILKPKEKFDIHSKIGIVDVRSGETSCLRTKNANLVEKTPVSIIISLDEPQQKILAASVEKKLDKSCARRASETGDKNPGENYFYSLILTDDKTMEEFGFDIGIAVIEPAKPIQIQSNLATIDLNEDGKPEFFRVCQGFEGFHFTIWTGKPLKGKRIWRSFYYVDYDTVVTCKKKDWEETED